ncbi:MAG: outer membrane homotrimeric porin [Desulfovibrio sp.]|nr:outer membrane homotrimeric porin [Desulfovibrio sp.]
MSLDAVASEALSGQLFFEIGSHRWGNGAASLGADNTAAIKLRRAYIDWMVPQTDLKIRMGLQGIALPSFTTQSMVFNDDVAGITASLKVNDNVGLTAVWVRPYNDNYTGGYEIVNGANGSNANRASYLDNVDAFALLVPLTFDGVKVTPWALYAAIGPNAFSGRTDTSPHANAATWNYNSLNAVPGTSSAYPLAGMLPVNGATRKDGTPTGKRLTSYADAWWLGLTGDITAFDPFRIAWDFNYGSVNWDDSHLKRQGWLASLLFEYKLDWGIPGLYGWYASGDDGNPANGSERMPSISTNNTNNMFSDFAMNGAPWNHAPREGVLSRSMTGTWGIGVRLKDVSFVEDLKHTLYLNYMGGTNSPTMAKYITGRKLYQNAGIDPDIVPWQSRGGGANSALAGMDPLYMTTGDSALEIGLRNVYQMYENFQIYFEGAYIATWLDKSKSVWGYGNMNGRSDEERDPWNINLSFVYTF